MPVLPADIMMELDMDYDCMQKAGSGVRFRCSDCDG